LRRDDDQLIRLARTELAALLNVTAEPLFARVHRWPQAMPQYNIGHLELLRQISKGASKLSGLMLAGSAFQGVGVSDCVRQGRDVARQLIVATRDMVSAT
jgi:oxygen-dependent protoporphyrinogen oxidase